MVVVHPKKTEAMKRSYKEIYRSGGFLALFIAALGFTTSCDTESDYPAPMYGSPSADYQIKVKVVDSADAPIRNIRTTLYGSGESKQTDSLGCADFKFRSNLGSFHGSFEDIDGADNGGQWIPIMNREFTFDQDQYKKYPAGQGNEWLMHYLNTEIKVVIKREK